LVGGFRAVDAPGSDDLLSAVGRLVREQQYPPFLTVKQCARFTMWPSALVMAVPKIVSAMKTPSA
jgi:hypothetical protein